MRVDGTMRTLIFLLFVHATVLIPGIPTPIRAAATLAYAVMAGWMFVSIFGLGATRPLDRLIYAVATSVTALMLIGLIANMILPFVGVVRPLQAATALIILDILVVSGMVFTFRTTTSTPEAKLKHASTQIVTSAWSIPVWIVGILPVLMAALGAQTLNAGGSWIISGLAIIVAVSLLMGAMILRSRTTDTTAAWLLFCAALTFLWIGWLRSNYVSGVDINVEYHLFEHTLSVGRWSLDVYRDSYNACMSITILPTLLATLTGLGPTTIFKLVMPILFALVPVATFVFLRRYVSTSLALAGATFVLAQHAYLLWWTIPIKQQVGLLLFSTLLLLISDRDLSPRTRFVSVLVVGLGMVVAHYTTTYVSIALLLGAGITVLMYRGIAKTKWGAKLLTKVQLLGPKNPTEASSTKRPLSIPIPAVLIILFATIAWYGLITNTEGSTVDSVQQVASSIGNVFDDDVRQAGTLTSVFNPFAQPPNEAQLLASVALDVNDKSKLPGRFTPAAYSEYRITTAPELITPIGVPVLVKKSAFALNEITKTLIKLFMLIGIGILFTKHLRRGDIEPEITFLVIFAFGVLAAMLFLPFASIVYSVSRAYQQVALVVALAFAIGAGTVIAWLNKWTSQMVSGIIVASILIIPILFYTGLVPILVGGTSPATMLANEGRNYDEVYVDRGEVLAAEWIFVNAEVNDIYAASRARHKLWLAPSFALSRTAEGVFPQSMHRDGYVYADSTNTIRGVGFVADSGTTLSYNYPLEFLEEQKLVVYSTRTSTVYR